MAALMLAGCAAGTAGKPYLSARAFNRAAAVCDVVPKGVFHARGSKVPFAEYRLAADYAPPSGRDETHVCLARALSRYRYQFFGEEVSPEK